MSEKEVRGIIRAVLRSEFSNVPTEAKIKKIAKDEFDKAFEKVSKEYITSKQAKDMIKQTMHAYHKWMWEKKGMWINQI